MTETPVLEALYNRWPLANRIFHWSLVMGFLLMWWSGENGVYVWHVRMGYIMVGLVVFRLVFGVIGPESGRLIHLIPRPSALWAYVKSLHPSRYRHAPGHNPLGGLSVLALLGLLSVQLITGLMATNTDAGMAGSLSQFVDYETGYKLAEIHHLSFKILLLFVGLHLAALLFYALYLRINLVGAMVTGRKRIAKKDIEEGSGKSTQGIASDVNMTLARQNGNGVSRLLISVGVAIAVVATLYII